jgi:hypothetical protein
MKRLVFGQILISGVLATLGCQHIGGKHDCGYHPNDYMLPPATNPYPSAPALGPTPPKIKTGGSISLPESPSNPSAAGY